MAQVFKGDALEIKMRASAEPAFDLASGALNDFYQGGEDCDEFLLMLYDEGRMPFSERIGRDVFVPFIRKALSNFPFIGNFESYLFILREIFGEESEILFDVTDPGELSISVNASSDFGYEFLGREFYSGTQHFFTLTTQEGDDLIFRGVAGIETEHELSLLFSEIMPAGIFPSVALDFFEKYFFVAEEDSTQFDVIDHLGNQIIFIEVGG